MGGEGAGGCGHALAAFKYSLNTKKMRARSACVVARKRRPGGVWAVGVVRAGGVWARSGEAGCGEGAGGCGHALAAFKYSLNIQKMQPGVGSGEAGVVWCGR